MFSRLKRVLSDPLGAALGMAAKIYAFRLARRKGIHVQGRITLVGIPIIDIGRNASLHIDDNVTLNSRNRGYHINMHSPVKLFADREGAEIRIGQNTRIHGACVHAYKSVTIGRNCLIAANCQIMDGSGHDLSFPNVEDRIHTRGDARPVVIEDNVWIGADSIVLPGVTIGRGSVISANSVVVRDVPPMALAGGNPASVIKDYSKA